MNDPNRFKFDTQEFYIKSADEMARTFPDHPEVCSRTMQFVDRCNLKLTKVDNPFPEFPVPEGHTLDSYFEAGLPRRAAASVSTPRSRTCAIAACSEDDSPTTMRASIANSTASSR